MVGENKSAHPPPPVRPLLNMAYLAGGVALEVLLWPCDRGN